MKRSRLMYTILVTVLLCSCGRNTSSELQQGVKQDEVQESNDFNQSIDDENDIQESSLSDNESYTVTTDTQSESTNETSENKTASVTSNSTNSSKKNTQGSSDTVSAKKTSAGQNTGSGLGNNNSSASTTTNKNNSSSSNSNTTNSNTASGTSSSTQHKHNWTAVYETVYHEAVCDTVWVIDKKAYTEEVTVYEWQSYPICSACGEDITGNVYEHTKAHALKGENAGHKEGWRQVAVGTETITHAEEGHYEYKEIKAAYTEKKLVGYKCSCGATK